MRLSRNDWRLIVYWLERGERVESERDLKPKCASLIASMLSELNRGVDVIIPPEVAMPKRRRNRKSTTEDLSPKP